MAFAVSVAGCFFSSDPAPVRQATDSSKIVAVVSGFHAALASGDSAAALRLLDTDALILESGEVETRSEYRSHHLAADIEFARAVSSSRRILRVWVVGDAGWVGSSSDARGRMGKRQINSAGAELVVLRRSGGQWKIAAIHWSSKRRIPPAGK